MLFVRRVLFLSGLVRGAQPTDRAFNPRRRVKNEATIVLGQRKLLQRVGPGLMHAFIFWGFLVLLPTILIAMIGIVDKHATLPWLGHQGWYAFLVDLFAVLVLVGVAAAVWIRKVQRPRRFEGSHVGEADLILALIATIALTLLLWHAARIAPRAQRLAGVGVTGVERTVGPVRSGRARPGCSSACSCGPTCLTILGFLAYLPYSKHLHIFTAAINVWFARTGPGGRLEPLRFDDDSVPEEELRFGVGTAKDLTIKEVLDGFSCTECGRCQDVCPAFATGKVLSPKLVIMGVRDNVFAQSEEPILGTNVPEEMIWDCVTCGACVQACPVSIEHVDHIVDLRRHQVMVESHFPAEAEPMLRDIERASNPWGRAQYERADWAEALDVRVLEPGDPAPEYLYWVGCASSFDERARSAAESTAKLLRRAGVDFAILGPRESCTGDPARRIGNEYVFQAFAEQNVATLNEAGVTKIIASCPHCFNTLGNEYPDFGGHYEVIHHSELLARLVRDGSADVRRGPAARGRQRSPTTTPATSPVTTTCSRGRGSLPPRWDRRWRWSARASRRSAAAPAARTCGWRSAPSRSTSSASARRSARVPTRSPSPVRTAP